MNKKLVTLAVAAALAAPAAAMAEATLYGVLHQSIDWIDQDDLKDANGNTIAPGFEGWSVNRADGTIIPTPAAGNGPVGPGNRVGVKGSEDLGSGLKAIYQVEFGVVLSDRDKTANNGDRGSVSMRNSFVGLAGDWGTFLVGRHDTPLKISTAKLDMFADTMADYNGPLAFDDVRADSAIAYISPSWNGFQLSGAIIPGGCQTASGSHTTDSGCGMVVAPVAGSGYVFSDSLAEAWSIAAIYSNGPWYASVAYEDMQDDMTGSNDPADVFDSYGKWRFGLGILDWNGFSLTGIYEDRANTAFVKDYDTESWQIQAGYAFGNNAIKASYGQSLREDFGGFDIGDLDQWTIGFDHNFSKRTKVYALYTNVNDDMKDAAGNGIANFVDWQGFSMGIVHKF